MGVFSSGPTVDEVATPMDDEGLMSLLTGSWFDNHLAPICML
jgi:hypothetical protein